MAVVLIAWLTVLGMTPPAVAATYPAGFHDRRVVAGLSQPTAVAFTPDGRTLITEKSGSVKLVAPGADAASLVLDISGEVNHASDRGLVGIAVDAGFEANAFVYLLYSAEGDALRPDSTAPGTGRLDRYTLSADNVLTFDRTILGTYDGSCPPPSGVGVDCLPDDTGTHAVGTVRADADGTLWVGSGDGARDGAADERALRAYDPRSLAGKILHVDRDGRGIPGHRFCPGEDDLDRACTKVHAAGFRNPFRFSLRPAGGLVVGDVGWTQREEVDLVGTPGRSYGWPCYEGSARTPGYRDLEACSDVYATEGSDRAQLPPDYEYVRMPEESAAFLGGPTYTADAYPAAYRGAIFVGDYGRGVLERLVMGEDGQVARAEPFARDWLGVDLTTAPGGDLVFVDPGDFTPGTGALRRISYSPGAAPPTARASVTPAYGDPPLLVELDASASEDPDAGDTLSYEWDFGDGSPVESGPRVSHAYADEGTFFARLRVTDGSGLRDTTAIRIDVGNTPPEIRLDAPATFRAGAPVRLAASVTDREDGAVPANDLIWSVRLMHVDHVHPHGTFYGEAEIEFTAAAYHDADSHYEVTLRATDATGLQATETARIDPETTSFTLASEPPGAPVTYGAVTGVAPLERITAVGFTTGVVAAAGFERDGRSYAFSSWSDGGARTHEIVVPATATTLVARYADVTPTPPEPPQPAPTPSPQPVPTVQPPLDRRGPAIAFGVRRGVNRRRGILRGRARDASGVRAVRVRVRGPRRGRPRCRGRRGPCWSRARIRPAGATAVRWKLRIGRRLPRGRYVVRVRARDVLGNETRRRPVRFRVRRR